MKWMKERDVSESGGGEDMIWCKIANLL